MTFSLLEITEKKRTFSSPTKIQAQHSKKIPLPSSQDSIYHGKRRLKTPS